MPHMPVYTSPWTWQATDFAGQSVSISVDFDNTSKALLGATVQRDAACLYTKVFIGVGADGTPNTSAHQVSVPAGTTAITAGQLSAIGLNTINDVTSLQITAGT